jgi:hypothetical protein
MRQPVSGNSRVTAVRIAARLARGQADLAPGPELASPRRQVRAVDALLAKQRLECAALAARDGYLGRLDQAELLGRCEPTPGAGLYSFVDRRGHDRFRLPGIGLGMRIATADVVLTPRERI